MATAGYSNKPLYEKLGLKPSMRIILIHPPDDYDALVGFNTHKQICKPNESPDFAHVFATSYNQLENDLNKLKPLIEKNKNIIIWVSWYKKSAKIPTDITEDSIRHYALRNKLVDVKVCAVSDTWSGLKLVVPLKDRN